MYFEYGDKELDFLRRKDKRLREVIDRIGHIDRTADTGLFSAHRYRLATLQYG